MNLQPINLTAALFSLFQIATGLVFGTGVLFLTFKFFLFWADKRYGIKSFNTSFSILIGSILFSVGLLLQEAISPAILTIQNLYQQSQDMGFTLLWGTIYMLIYFALSMVFSFCVIFLAYFLFTVLTRKINEMDEIKHDNIAISIILGVVIIVMVLLVKGGFSQLVDAIIPVPELHSGIRL
ncbi:MAG: DUF350 domain-containing protein [Spirochaetaceae bacterium]|nr:MAG: DUF350 domain-containing protein [Spirochaetaceae bacterium]